MEEHVLNSPMIFITMGDDDVVLSSNGYNHWERWLLIFEKYS